MFRYLMAAAAIYVLFLAWGCKSNPPSMPLPDPPRFNGDPFLAQDSSDARDLHVVRISFNWMTDRPSTDEFYFGSRADTLLDSLEARNLVAVPQPGGTPLFGHVAPAPNHSTLEFSTLQPFFYRIRARGANGQSGFSQVYRYLYPNAPKPPVKTS